MLDTKSALYDLCLQRVKQMVVTAQQSIQQAEEATRSETKSSAGDKFETGRAMAHAEMHKAQRSFAEAKMMLTDLQSIDVETSHHKIQKGALIETDAGFYFLSVGLGKLALEQRTFFVMSTQSPLGTLFLNKGVGEQITFRGTTIRIKAII